jgi:hypothetical protein
MKKPKSLLAGGLIATAALAVLLGTTAAYSATDDPPLPAWVDSTTGYAEIPDSAQVVDATGALSTTADGQPRTVNPQQMGAPLGEIPFDNPLGEETADGDIAISDPGIAP